MKAYAEREGLQDFEIKHNQKIETYDSTYQIDVLAEYTALGCHNKVIIECKHHTGNIKRTVVTDLCAKIQSIGAQKGIIISTSGFQKDAVTYAQIHGIALWQIVDTFIRHFTNSVRREPSPQMEWVLAVDHFLPKYFVAEWDYELDWPSNEIYPTPQMYKIAKEKAKEYLKEHGSNHV